jgi:peptide/nickel transport system ATP-binding protein
VESNTLLQVNNLKMYFPIKKGFFRRVTGYVRAVDNVSFSIQEGETLGLVGESGCGKTTTGRCILRAYDPTEGEILFRMHDDEPINLAALKEREMREVWRNMQLIFQDPYGSLNPRMTVKDIIGEPLLVQNVARGGDLKERVGELMRKVGLQTLNHLTDHQLEFHLTYLFIAHDLGVVRYISDRVAVMYVGKLVELAKTGELFNKPIHPYTEALLSAVPKHNPKKKSQRIPLAGEVADPADPPTGCYFHPRCRYAEDKCKTEEPALSMIKSDDGNEHYAACHFADSLELKGI